MSGQTPRHFYERYVRERRLADGAVAPRWLGGSAVARRLHGSVVARRNHAELQQTVLNTYMSGPVNGNLTHRRRRSLKLEKMKSLRAEETGR
jgi:hypothetical protein